ncbi:MAG: isoprenylcysteine carboxylmethyltransferase family protein [Limibacillus sp.]|jgi:methyltransferase
MNVGLPQILVILVAVQRLIELWVARRNTKRLLARGGQEVGRRHYPVIIALHSAWLLSVFLLGDPDGGVLWLALGAFLVLQTIRVWVVLSLGEYWTTRIITLPGEPLVKRGPYRFLRHPNYAVVVGEIALLPIAFGLWKTALIFSLLNGAILWVRIRAEESAISTRRDIRT